jgi:hypothetical protein
MWHFSFTPDGTPFGIPAPARDLEAIFRPPPVQNHSNHVPAYVWTEPLDISNPERALQILQSVGDQSGLGSSEPPLTGSPIFKFPESQPKCGKEVIEPWPDIVRGLMPARGTHFERLVIAHLRLLDQSLKAYITANIVALLIKGQQSQQPRYPAVPVTKRVDAKEIEHKPGNCQESYHLPLIQRRTIGEAKLLQRCRHKFRG